MSDRTLWETLWDLDPNCLFVVNPKMEIKVINPAFTALFQAPATDVIGKSAALFFDDMSDFQVAWKQEITITREKSFARYGTYMRLVIFPLKQEELIACIMVNLTQEHEHDIQVTRLKEELLTNVNQVIDKQMSIAQQIAGLLGETTAEAKISLLKIRNMLDED